MKKLLKNEEIGDLYFGQTHHLHRTFFDRYAGHHYRVKLRELPHYRVLARNTLQQKNNAYEQYLKRSWKYYYPKENTQEKRQAKIETYSKLLRDIQKNGISKPIEITDTCDGGRMLLEGNHRASIAYHLALDVPYTHVTIEEALAAIYKGVKPAQSIYFGTKELLEGEKRDAPKLIAKMDLHDIRGRAVLDVSPAPMGSAALLWRKGAMNISVIEPGIRPAAATLRASTLLGVPVVADVFDLSKPLRFRKRYDTVVCFSDNSSDNTTDTFLKNIAKLTKGVFYFDAVGITENDRMRIGRHFKDISEIKVGKRTLFRCTNRGRAV